MVTSCFAGHGGDVESHACISFSPSASHSVTQALPVGVHAEEAAAGRILWVEYCVLDLRVLLSSRD